MAVIENGLRTGRQNEHGDAASEDEEVAESRRSGTTREPGRRLPSARQRQQHRGERGEAPLGPTESREPRQSPGEARAERAAGEPAVRRDEAGGERESGRLPDPVTHAEKGPSGVGHEEERRDRQRRPENRLAPARHAAERRVENGENEEARRNAGRHQRRETRAEQAEETGLEVGSERAEPIDDVPVEQGSPRERVRDDPFAPRVDQGIRPLPPGNDPERGGRGGEEGERESSCRPSRPRRGAAPSHQRLAAGRPSPFL